MTDKITADWLKRGMIEDAKNCNCEKCKKILEAMKVK